MSLPPGAIPEDETDDRQPDEVTTSTKPARWTSSFDGGSGGASGGSHGSLPPENLMKSRDVIAKRRDLQAFKSDFSGFNIPGEQVVRARIGPSRSGEPACAATPGREHKLQGCMSGGDAVHRGRLPPARHTFHGPPEVNLSVDRFIRQFFYHALYPLTWFIVPLVEGWDVGRVMLRRQLWLMNPLKTGWSRFFLSTLNSVWVALICVIWVVSGEYNATGDVLMMLFIFLLRTGVIAIKYATMTPAQYQFLRSSDVSDEDAWKVGMDLQILSGWLDTSAELMQKELDRAQASEQVSMAKAFFYIDQPALLLEWAKSTGADKCPHSKCRGYGFDEKNKRATIGYVATTLLYMANQSASKKARRGQYLAAVIGISYSVAAFVVRGTERGSPWSSGGEATAAEKFVSVACALANGPYVYLLCMFMVAGVVDYERRATIMKAVGDIMGSYRDFEMDLQGNTHIVVSPPMMDMRRPTNVASWMYLRNCVIAYGKPYQYRIQMYTGFGIVVSIMGTAWSVIDLLAWDPNSGTPMMYAGVGNPDDANIYSVTGSVFMIFIFLAGLLMLLYGIMINRAALQHRALLTRQQMNVRQLLRIDAEEDLKVALATSDKLIDSCSRVIKSSDLLQPTRIVGLRADTFLLRSIFTVAASAAIAVMQKFARSE